jgi:hypothetical protein
MGMSVASGTWNATTSAALAIWHDAQMVLKTPRPSTPSAV